MTANRMAVLQRFTLEGVVIISVSMLERLRSRVDFLCAFAHLSTIDKRKFRPNAGGNHTILQLQMVEAGGVEPPSEKRYGSKPTCLAQFRLFRQPRSE